MPIKGYSNCSILVDVRNFRSLKPGTLFQLSPGGQTFLKLKYNKCVNLEEFTLHNFLGESEEEVVQVIFGGKFTLHSTMVKK